MTSPPSSRTKALITSLRARVRPYAPYLIASSLLAWLAIRNIFADAKGPAVPLDDSYIHFVYAKRFAQFEPFVFSPGDGPTSGATSFLWPLLLAPFYLIGFHDSSIIWAAWLLGTVLHAATALETKRLAEKVAGPIAAVGASVMCLLFGAFAWFAWSGMETMGLAWSMTRAIRLTADYAEATPAQRTGALARKAAIAGALCPLFRPEGGFIALVVAGAILLLSFRNQRRIALSSAALATAGVLISPVFNWLLTGHARSTTTMVKWGPGNPYYVGERLSQFFFGNVQMFLTELLSAGPFTTIFLPDYTHYVLAAGLLAFLAIIVRTKNYKVGGLILLFVLSSVIPCTFITILWNRVRYIWPYAPAWFVLVACLGHEIAAMVGKLTKTDVRWVAGIVTGVFAGALGTKLTWALNDLANSSRAITEQQVKLGRWAKDNLPADARIGLNDTGAIAYFSERRTFDVVGLTTQGEAPYWVQGSGSRYEHYERLGADKLPTHFIVYPEWMGIPGVLGEELFSATVTNQSILGGNTKVAFVADWSNLGRGARPMLRERQSTLVDELDVADVESEKEHAYDISPWATEGDNRVVNAWNDAGDELGDGGRFRRTYDSFKLNFTGTTNPVLVMRVAAPEPIKVSISVDEAVVGEAQFAEGVWTELDFPLKAMTGVHKVTITAVPGQLMARRKLGEDGQPLPPEPKTFGTMHYWLFAE